MTLFSWCLYGSVFVVGVLLFFCGNTRSRRFVGAGLMIGAILDAAFVASTPYWLAQW